MSQFKKSLITFFMFLSASDFVFAADHEQYNLTITKLRLVGNYSQGTLYDNTVEMHFTPAVTWPTGLPCNSPTVVYIDKNDQHIVSAVYMAFAAGKKIHIHIDTTLPIRNSTCQVSFIDVLN